ncbi:hypothetical protein SAMN04488051_108146 [Alkalimonas amylolytica]|uniref:Uncharacterized protein n=1 Tax=Alkalimonas amylolytica TaxID=152573 RepID=A0A1H4F1A8_ALKAM|nr:hypothetical protein SAMN04488051_108146 [Alkalimonas amylolytica]
MANQTSQDKMFIFLYKNSGLTERLYRMMQQLVKHEVTPSLCALKYIVRTD